MVTPAATEAPQILTYKRSIRVVPTLSLARITALTKTHLTRRRLSRQQTQNMSQKKRDISLWIMSH